MYNFFENVLHSRSSHCVCIQTCVSTFSYSFVIVSSLCAHTLHTCLSSIRWHILKSSLWMYNFFVTVLHSRSSHCVCIQTCVSTFSYSFVIVSSLCAHTLHTCLSSIRWHILKSSLWMYNFFVTVLHRRSSFCVCIQTCVSIMSLFLSLCPHFVHTPCTPVCPRLGR